MRQVENGIIFGHSFSHQINVLMLPIFCARVFSEPSSFNIYCGFNIQ